MANTNIDTIVSSMGRSQDPNFDDILSGMGGSQPGGPIVITLGTLSLSTAITTGTVTNGTINGATSGSTITSNVTGLTVNSGARTFSFDGAAPAATTNNGLVETLAGVVNSPRSTPVTVAAAPVVTPPPTGAPLAAWRTALAASRAGTAPAVISNYGDSTTAGSYGGTTPNGFFNQAKQGSFPHKLQGLFEASGLSYGGSDLCSLNSNTTTNFGATDAQVTQNGGWAWSGLTSSVGGPMFRDQSGTVPMRYTPAGMVNTFDIYYPLTTVAGETNVTLNGVVQEKLIHTAAQTGFAKKTYAVGAPASVLFEIAKSGGTGYFAFIEARNSQTLNHVRVRNQGWSGSKVSDWLNVGNPWSAGNSLSQFKADLHIINLGINDADGNTSTPIATFKDNYRQIINKARTQGGSVLLLGFVRSNPADTAYSAQETYISAISALAAEENCAYLDLKNVLGDWTAATAAGDMADNKHPTAAGYGKIAAAIYSMINETS